MAGTISFDGLATGINATETVDKLIEVESRPKILKEAEKTRLENERDSWRALNTKLLALRDATRELWLSKTWATLKVSSTNSGVVTATSTSSAKAGTYTLSVEKLALNGQKTSKQYDAATSAVGTGTLTVTVGTQTANITVTDSNNTLSAIASAINGADIGATASVVKDGTKYRLLVSADETGVENDVTLSGDVATALTMTTVQAAQDAQIKFGTDGAGSTALSLTSASNKIEGVIEGVTLNLVSASPGEAITLTTSRDSGAVEDAVQNFADAYNDVLGYINDVTKYDTETKTRAVLQADTAVRTIADRLRAALSESVATGGAYRTLRAVGVTLNDDGTLEYDADKMTEAMGKDYESVEKLFRSESGAASRVDSYLRNITLPLVGLLDRKQTALDEGIKSAQERIEDMQARLDQRRESLMEQFLKMETAVNQFNTQSGYLTSQLAGINKNWG